MAADPNVVDRLLAALAPLPVTVRAMFGGRGLYLEARYFGLIDGKSVYFRTDEATRDEYISRGMPAFQPASRPRGPRTVDRNFQVPPEILNDPDQLKEWALRAAATRR